MEELTLREKKILSFLLYTGLSCLRDRFNLMGTIPFSVDEYDMIRIKTLNWEKTQKEMNNDKTILKFQ